MYFEINMYFVVRYFKITYVSSSSLFIYMYQYRQMIFFLSSGLQSLVIIYLETKIDLIWPVGAPLSWIFLDTIDMSP